METETIDKLFLELSQFTNAETNKEHTRMRAVAIGIKAFERIEIASTLKEAKKEARTARFRMLRSLKV